MRAATVFFCFFFLTKVFGWNRLGPHHIPKHHSWSWVTYTPANDIYFQVWKGGGVGHFKHTSVLYYITKFTSPPSRPPPPYPIPPSLTPRLKIRKIACTGVTCNPIYLCKRNVKYISFAPSVTKLYWLLLYTMLHYFLKLIMLSKTSSKQFSYIYRIYHIVRTDRPEQTV